MKPENQGGETEWAMDTSFQIYLGNRRGKEHTEGREKIFTASKEGREEENGKGNYYDCVCSPNKRGPEQDTGRFFRGGERLKERQLQPVGL